MSWLECLDARPEITPEETLQVEHAVNEIIEQFGRKLQTLGAERDALAHEIGELELTRRKRSADIETELNQVRATHAAELGQKDADARAVLAEDRRRFKNERSGFFSELGDVLRSFADKLDLVTPTKGWLGIQIGETEKSERMQELAQRMRRRADEFERRQ